MPIQPPEEVLSLRLYPLVRVGRDLLDPVPFTKRLFGVQIQLLDVPGVLARVVLDAQQLGVLFL